ncbi:MAG TPA: hypothetical protein VKH63_01885 [Candidatus Acidoferrum sp.]|nr:hypothetical protein [Candidatus Acidoferrum sp.]
MKRGADARYARKVAESCAKRQRATEEQIKGLAGIPDIYGTFTKTNGKLEWKKISNAKQNKKSAGLKKKIR